MTDKGRQSGDPSKQMLILLHELQHTRPQDTLLIAIPPDLYREAHAMVLGSKNAFIQSPLHAQMVHILLCGHWITPENPATGSLAV